MRKRRAVQWALVVVAFCVFASLLTGMTGFGARTVNAAAASVAQPRAGAIIVFKRFPAFNRFFGLSPQLEVCWVEPWQLKQIKARWLTSVHTIHVSYRQHHHAHVGKFNLVTVYGPSIHALRNFVSPRRGVCTMVHSSWAFFLPFDGSVS